jgi:hypothetical protein
MAAKRRACAQEKKTHRRDPARQGRNQSGKPYFTERRRVHEVGIFLIKNLYSAPCAVSSLLNPGILRTAFTAMTSSRSLKLGLGNDPPIAMFNSYFQS